MSTSRYRLVRFSQRVGHRTDRPSEQGSSTPSLRTTGRLPLGQPVQASGTSYTGHLADSCARPHRVEFIFFADCCDVPGYAKSGVHQVGCCFCAANGAGCRHRERSWYHHLTGAIMSRWLIAWSPSGSGRSHLRQQRGMKCMLFCCGQNTTKEVQKYVDDTHREPPVIAHKPHTFRPLFDNQSAGGGSPSLSSVYRGPLQVGTKLYTTKHVGKFGIPSYSNLSAHP